ncbi:DUF3662 and FHA domain-containing protein [uncultured Corynebacterium sp.]|uniref:DUF3662 and FHA domain-containing protein n=1 Tax=uncultured Corynebacterium sp. TaxID=159447 RepID=UPI0025F2E044|nr:DUF3662 and FHA domain-containing protein [uncultured Corynebacterium sp.]
MSLFGRFKKLDSSLQRGLDNGFARVFGGEVVPTEIDEVLKQYAEESVMTDAQGQRLAPSYFQVLVSTRDYASLTEARPRLAEEMGDRLSRFIRNQGWRTNEPVTVNLSAHNGLHSGQMRADARFDVPRTEDRPNANVAIGEDSSEQAGRPEWPSSQPGERSLVSHDYDAPSSNDDPSSDAQDRDPERSLGDLVSPADAQHHHNESAGAAGLAGATGAAAAGVAGVHRAAPDFARNQWTDQAQQAEASESPASEEPHDSQEPWEPRDHQALDEQENSAVHNQQNWPNQQEGNDFERPVSYPGTEVIVQSTPSPVRGGVGADGSERELRVTLTLHDGSDRTYELRKGSNIIGRGNGVDLRIPDTGVSRQHADITWDGYDAVLTDLQSTNGTSVNGTPIENWLLASGDVISLGHSEIGVEFH